MEGEYLSLDTAKKIAEKDKKIERLNKLISQREKKWEKWTTEKTILSTKMSDYLCKYQNLKREYTKQIKISTDRKGEIERLTKRLEESQLAFLQVDKEKQRLNNIIKELEKDLKGKIDEDRLNILSNSHWKYILDKLQELKGSDKE